MKIVLTGANGTLGRALVPVLLGEGHVSVVWNRRLHSPTHPQSYEAWILAEKPDAIVHLAIASSPTGYAGEDELVTVSWTENLARIADRINARFVFASTVMVFCGAGENGPFYERTTPRRPHSYGQTKLIAEEMLQELYPGSTIARLGWQIDSSLSGNQMLAQLNRQNQSDGCIRANRNWIPACSFVGDSAVALERILHREAGIFHIDSNRGWSFVEIVSALRERFCTEWKIEEEDGERFDQRLLGAVSLTPDLDVRLPALRRCP